MERTGEYKINNITIYMTLECTCCDRDNEYFKLVNIMCGFEVSLQL